MARKIEELERKIRILEKNTIPTKKKKKAFKMPFKVNRIIKMGTKAPGSIVSQYLTQDGKVAFKTCRVISGNIIVVNNKAHKLNPQDLWRCGKQTWYIHREIDRNPVPVSNEDYEEVKKSGNDTENDVVLIKAVLGAMMKPKKEIKGNWVVGVVIAVVVGIVIFIMLKGGG